MQKYFRIFIKSRLIKTYMNKHADDKVQVNIQKIYFMGGCTLLALYIALVLFIYSV